MVGGGEGSVRKPGIPPSGMPNNAGDGHLLASY